MRGRAALAVLAAVCACGDAGGSADDSAGSTSVGSAESVGPGPTGPDGEGSGGCLPTEYCDGIDNDCDGTVDEDCDCMPGDTQPCYAGPDETLDVGACQGGTQSCMGGVWAGECVGDIVPTDEACNRVDDDCDGVLDEACGGWTVEIPSSRNGARDVAFDAMGNVFITGSVLGGFDYGGGEVPGIDGDDAFIASYRPDGSYRWAIVFGSTGNDEGYGLAVAPSSDVWVVGQAGADSDFGGGTVTGFGIEDGFVARFTNQGNFVDARVFGSALIDAANAIAIDGTGRVVVVGEIDGVANLGGADLDGATGHAVIAQYDADGTHLWSLNAGSGNPDVDAPLAVVTDDAGNVYVTGEFAGLATYGGDTFDGGDKADIFLLELDAAGAHVWSKKFGDSNFVENVAHSIALAPSGDIVLTGIVIPAIDFGGGVLAGNGSLFVASFDPDGNHLWSLRSEGTQEEFAYGRGVAVAADGTVLVTGYYDQHVDLGTVGLPVSDEIDVMLFALDAAGTPTWGERLVSPFPDDHDYGMAVAVGSLGVYAVAGEFRNRAFVRVFGP